MRRAKSLRLERLEDRTTPSTTTTVSFVPDGTTVGAQQSHLYQDYSGIAPAVWQQHLLNDLQQRIAPQAGVMLTLVSDDGASMNASAPQDGVIRVAAVDQLFASDGSVVTAPPGSAYEVVSGTATFGMGLGLTGPNGGPLSPAPQNPSAPSPWSLILPIQKAYGNLYPTGPSGPSGPTNPTPTGPSYTMPSGPSGTTAPTLSGPTYTMPSGPTYTMPSGPTYTTDPTLSGPTYTMPSGPTYTMPSGPTY